jgi:mRNA interferase RelE/StbE
MKIAFARGALKSLDRLPRTERERIIEAIEGLPAGDVKKLQGRDGFRLRVGSWRVLYRVDGELATILDVGARGGIYR